MKYAGKLDVGGAVGTDGALTVMKDFGEGDPYIGQSPLVSGEIAEDLTSYYANSEQTPTVCALGVLTDPESKEVINAGGLLIQLLPTSDSQVIARVEGDILDLKPITTLLGEGLSPLQICQTALPSFRMQELGEYPIAYRCNCSRDRVERALISTGKESLTEIEQDPQTEVVCHFCRKKYLFTPEQIRSLLQNA